MMAQIAYQYCTGPVNCFAQVNPSDGTPSYAMPTISNGSALYLGTCEQYPLVQGVQEWSPTYNDRRGPMKFDTQYFGESKVLIMDLNKMVQANLDAILNFGSLDQALVGAFKRMNGQSFVVWLQFTNFGQPIAPADMPAGECYFFCNVSESAYDPIGTRARKTRIIVEADMMYTVGANGSVFQGYSTDAGFFGGLPQVA